MLFMMDFLTFPANFRLLQLWFSVQLCYYIYAQLSIKKKIFDIVRTILYNIFTAVNGGAPVSTAIFWRFCTCPGGSAPLVFSCPMW